MDTKKIDKLICRARRAWTRRPEFNGRHPTIKDSDIVLRDGIELIQLCGDGEVIAEFAIRQNGDLRFLREGKYD